MIKKGIECKSISIGDGSLSSATGNKSIACCFGIRGMVMAGKGGILILMSKNRSIHVAYVGKDGIKANRWYGLNDKDEFELCDFDGYDYHRTSP